MTTPQHTEAALIVADSLSKLRDKTIVVKYGGNAMTSPDLALSFCQDIVSLQSIGIRVVVVHGGGPQITAMLTKIGAETNFEGGMRVSSPEVVDIAEMVLGSVNKQISNGISAAGGRALGLSGRDDHLLECTKQVREDGLDLGRVGKVQKVNTKLLKELLDMGIIPIVAPIGSGMGKEFGMSYNVNADVAAGRIAGELKAEQIIFLTDIAGVMDKEMNLLPRLSTKDVKDLIADDTITGGMIPKVTYAMDAIELGVKKSQITDGRIPHAVLNRVFYGDSDIGDGGTIIA